MWTKLVGWFAGLVIPSWLPVALVALVAFGGAWKIQSWRMDAMETQYLKAERDAKDEARKQEQAWNTRFRNAINQGIEREKTYRSHATTARAAADSMRVQLDANQRKLSELTKDALVLRASTYSDIFGACVTEYQRVAEEADRHINDKIVLRDAFPVQ